MKTLIFWIWAFGFAIARYLGNNNSDNTIYVFERNIETAKYISENRTHPFFFWKTEIWENVTIVFDWNLVLDEIDLIILAIPSQYVTLWIEEFRDLITAGNIWILNLSKWVDAHLNTVSDRILNINPNISYATLSGGMIAQDIINNCPVAADLGTNSLEWWLFIKQFLESDRLNINLTQKYRYVEFAGTLKNIASLYVWYLEGKWCTYSTIWYKLCNILKELTKVMNLLCKGNEDIFLSYSWWWDLFASIIGESRNKQFWRMIWSGKSLQEALEFINLNNLTIEGYWTLKAVLLFIKWSSEYPLLTWFWSELEFIY